MSDATIKDNKKTKTIKVFKIIGNVFVYILFIFSIVFLGFSIASKKSGNEGMQIGNHRLMNILSSSMEQCEVTDVSNYDIKSLPVGTLISVETVPEDEQAQNNWYKNIKIGDVLTFKYYYTSQEIITHRVIDIKPNNVEDLSLGYKIVLQGDNRADEEQGLLQQVINTNDKDSPNFVIGKVVWSSYFLGQTINLFKSKMGIIFIVIVPCSIIIIWEIISLTTHVVNNKKIALEKNNKDKDEEIQELKRQLKLAKDNKENGDKPKEE